MRTTYMTHRTRLTAIIVLMIFLTSIFNIPVLAGDPAVEYAVSFIYNGQTLQTKLVPEGTTVNADEVQVNITESGKVFSHWSLEVNGAAFDFSSPINEDTNLYVVTKDAWTVTFHSHGGSAVLPKYVEGGNAIGTLPSPTRAGYVFKHWSLTDGGAAISPSYQVTENITLHAVWEASTATSYKVVYWQENANDNNYTFEEIVTKTGKTGETATYDAKSYTGFHFDHADDTTISANGDTVVNVHYNRNIHTFVIEYRDGSWETYSTTQLKYGQSTAAQYNAAVAAYPYYTWYISRTSNTAYSEAPTMPNENLTVHGRYSGSAYQYTIGYYELDTNTQIKAPYSFYSGYGNLSFSIEDGINIPGFTVTPMSKWDTLRPNRVSKIYYTRNNYTLTFNKNNGESALVVPNIPYEGDISDKDTTGLNASSTFVQNGITYYFAGWYDNSACAGTPYTLAGKTMPAQNLSLYAKWTPEKYTVTFYNTSNPAGGIFHTEENITPLSTISAPAGHPQQGTFIGWYWDEIGSFVPFDFGTPISGNFRLYPVYENQTAKVTYDANGGTGDVPADDANYLVGADARVKFPFDLSKTGYFFDGWNTKADGSGTSYKPFELALVPAGGLTLHAQWKERTPLTFKGDSDNKIYNGSEQSLPNFKVTGLAEGHSYQGISYAAATGKDVGDYYGEFSGEVVVKDSNGVDVTNHYIITMTPGKLTIDPKAVTITTGGASKAYDGTPLTNATASIDGLVGTESVTLVATGSQTEVGSNENTYNITWDNAIVTNYTINENLGTLTVTKNDAEVILTAPSDSKTYDGTALTKMIIVTATGLPEGFTVTATATGSQKDAGSSANVVDDGYVIKDKNGNDKTANFTTIKKADGTLTVNPKAVTITTGSDSKAYDGTALTNATVGIEGLVDGETVTLTATGSQTEVGSSDNTYSITWDNATATNYTVTNNLGKLTVTTNAATVTLTAPSASKTYDGTALTKTTGVTATGLPAGFTVEATASGSQTNAGSSANVVNDGYVIKDAQGNDKTANFTSIAKVPGTLTVNPKEVTVTTGSDSKTYDGTALTEGTASIAGLVDGETATVEATGSQTNAATSFNTYKITWGSAKKDNYTVKESLGTLTVNPKEVTVKTGSASKAYDGTALTEGTAEIEGLVGTESVTLTATGSQTEVGSSDNTYSITWDNATATNYTVTKNLGTLTVTKNTATVTLTAPSDSKTYDGTALTKTTGVTATGLPAGFTVEATATGSQTDAGSSANVVDDGYVIKDAQGNDKTANFTNVTTANGTLTVNAKAVTITTGGDSKAYDGTALTNATVGIEGLVDGESVTLATTGSQTEVGSSDNTYSITWGSAKEGNYTVTKSLGTLTVTKNTATVTLTAPSDSKTYDGTALTKTTGVTATGLPAGFTVEATATGSQTDAGSSANVVDNGYVIKDANGIDKTANFTNVTTADGTLTVNPKAVTITTGSDSKAYDGTALTEGTAEIEGLVDGESVTLTATGSQTEVGDSKNTYSITWDNAKASNYAVTDALGTLTVTTNDAAVTLTAPSDSKTYDGTALTKTTGVTATGLPAGFTVEATASGSQTDVGNSANVVNNGYVIKDANGNDKTANFTNITKADGTLTVNAKAVTITTGSDSKAYDGTALTEGTAEIEGLVDGESVTLATTGSQTEVGDSKNTYSITWDNAKASNYAVTDALGTLTVTTNDAAVTLTAPSDSKTYDGTALTKTTGVTATGLPAGFTVEATASGSQTDVGNSANVVDNGYVIKDANGNDKTANFTNVTTADGTLTVNAKAVTITTGSDSKAYDGTALTEGTAEIEGLVDGESVTLATTGSQTEVGDSKNTYSITWDNAKASNYAVTDALGTLTVTTNDAAVTLTAPSDSKTYDGTALTKTTGVTATGLPAGFTVEATASGSQTDVGNSANVVDNGYVIKDANGNDKTANFTNVTTADGTLTVNPKAVTVTTGSASKVYDGTALTNATVGIAGLVDGQSVTLVATGSQTRVGSSNNTYSITWDNATAANYKVIENLGKLTVRAGGGPNPTPPTTPDPTPGPGGPEEIIPEDGVVESITISERETPLSGGTTAAWALLNLLLTILTGIIMIALLIGYFTGRKREEEDRRTNRDRYRNQYEDESKLKRKGFLRLLSFIPLIVAVIVFILTEDMRNPMVFVDRWTIWMAVIAAVQVILALFCKKSYEEDEDNKEYWNLEKA
jgi:uncharacterized repeat protein (TIGR02543 family)